MSHHRILGGIALACLWSAPLDAQCIRVDALTCFAGVGQVRISWRYPAGPTYTSVTILREGIPIPGSPFSFPTSAVTDKPGEGTHVYTVTPICSTPGVPLDSICIATLTPVPKHVILDKDDGGLTDSEDSLRTALAAVCSASLTISDVSDLVGTAFSADNILWSLAGTFPDNTPLTPATGLFLRDHVSSGGPVYHEGGDTFAFDPITAFADVDGVDNSASLDGDDTFTSMVGSAFGGADMSAFFAVYNQDQVGNDWTDRLVPSSTDFAGPFAGVIWSRTGFLYDTGIFYDTTAPNGKVISVSWEFGGFQGDPRALVIANLDALGQIWDFVRGDANADGTIDIADPITILTYLFGSGDLPPCGDSADVNDDGVINIADTIYDLSFLFSSGAPPPPPFPSCGADPTTDYLICDEFDSCPTPVPSNDECAGALAVFLGPNAITSVGATESADPAPAPGAAACAPFFGENDNDVWYEFIPSSSGIHEFNSCAIPGWDTDMVVYQGACGALTQIACNGDGSGLAGCQPFYSRLQVSLVAGASYTVRIGSWQSGVEGTGTLTITALGPEVCDDGIDNDLDGLIDCADTADCQPGLPPCLIPSNDTCSGAQPISCGDVVVGNTVTATPDVMPFCETSDGTAGGVWYTFLGNGDLVTLTTCNPGTDYDSQIRVWQGNCGALVCVTGNDDMGPAACPLSAQHSQVQWLSTPGVQYRILVHGFVAAQGNFAMTVSCVPLPPNDDCSNATPIGEGTFLFDNTAATLDGPTSCVGPQTTDDVWFLYTASNSGIAMIRTCATTGTLVDTTLSVWNGALGCPPASQCLAGNDDGCGPIGFNSQVAIPVVSGGSYLIQVSGWFGTTGGGTLTVGF